MKSAYLAGPITGLSYEGATDWREYATQRLEPEIKAFSPMRAKDFLKRLETISNFVQHEFKSPFVDANAIVGRDRNDVLQTDLVLMNLLGAERVSIGTMVELGWADAFRKPVVLVWDFDKNIHWHEFVKALSPIQVPDLESGIEATKTILLGR